MGLDFDSPPMDLLHMPSIHPGMSYLPPAPDWVLRPVPAAEIRLLAASDSDAVLEMQQSAIDRQEHRLLASVMEIAAAPVVLEHAHVSAAYVTIGGRLWLNGDAGDGLRDRATMRGDEGRMQQQASAFRRARERGGEYRPPVWAGAADLPIAISLAGRDPVALAGDLVHFAGDDSDQPIDLHLNPDDVPPVQDMVAALFPMLAARVRPVTTPKDYAAVRSVFDHRHYLYQVQDSRITRALAHVHDPRWRMLRSEARYRRAVATASFASSLPLLRHHARQQIASRDLPRRVWLGDDPHHGQAELLEQLTARGFQAVAPHRMPLSQVIALMQGAEIVVAPAGVGLAQMLHMRRDALAIHLDRAQVLADGWGRHLPAAHAARCRYVTVLVDDDAAGASPGIRIGKRATDRILRVVDLHLSRRQQTAMA